MSANKMSDEELDDLFKKSVDSFEPPFDPEAWMAMEQKLDQAQVHAPWYKRLLPFLLLMLLSTLLLVTQWKDENRMPADDTAARGMEVPPLAASTPLVQPAQKAGAADMAASREIQPATPPEEPEPVAPRRPGIARAAAKQRITQAAGTVPPGSETLLPVPATSAEEALDTARQESPNVYAADARQAEGFEAAQPLTAAADSTAEENILAAADSSTEKSSSVKKSSPFGTSIRVAIIAAPDFTTVKFKNPEAVSANVGMVVGVPLTDRLSLLTGMVWANKIYGAAPEDYNPGAYYWQGKKIPDAIDATCRVLDIPLNLEYRLLQRNKSALAIQAGLSSYIMLDEKYTYIYGTGYSTYEKIWEVKNENRHWFKVQNISISYTHHLSPSFFVGAEPYVKIPRSGIGAGNVKLTSAGIFISAGYNLSLKK
ncbi:hypothetical protein GCM10023188_04520 [Pontibacter saemangeumensis]|uniref:Outer membrane protein beta-barrel domain-containing protein n=1 Tax=Pontibacter saemangeumensis TaxID=1084525 RepID=A0ABP8LA33_9BACT